MGYDARTPAFAALSAPQRLALIDMVNRGGMYRINAGYDGSRVHARGVIVALEKRGLCHIKRLAGCMGGVDPTPAGVILILKEFDGAKPSLADCDSLGRLLPAAKNR